LSASSLTAIQVIEEETDNEEGIGGTSSLITPTEEGGHLSFFLVGALEKGVFSSPSPSSSSSTKIIKDMDAKGSRRSMKDFSSFGQRRVIQGVGAQARRWQQERGGAEMTSK
jgi:hypothetical protein